MEQWCLPDLHSMSTQDSPLNTRTTGKSKYLNTVFVEPTHQLELASRYKTSLQFIYCMYAAMHALQHLSYILCSGAWLLYITV